MSKIIPSLSAVLLSLAFMPPASAQTAEKTRDYGLNLGLDAARNWSEDGSTYNQMNANGSLLFLNEHFHFGPSLSYSRNYTSYYATTSWGFGLTGKWTLENIQTQDNTPFFELSGFINKAEGGDWDGGFPLAQAAVGYEMFLNQYVSLAPSINFRKMWEKSQHDLEAISETQTRASSEARLHLGVNVYL